MASHSPATTAPLPPHVMSILYPRKIPDTPGPDDLIGKQIRYPHRTSGETKEFLVCDYVTSRMKGSHFLVSYDYMEEDEIIEEDDMEDILRNRLDETSAIHGLTSAFTQFEM